MSKQKKESAQRCIYLTKKLNDKLTEHSLRYEVPVSYIIRMAVAKFFENHEKELAE